MIFLLLIGLVMDLTPAILIFTPVLLPLVKMAGIDPVYFGIVMVINLCIGLITPPVGTVLYVGCGISKISLADLTKGIWPFLVVHAIVLALLILFPEIITVPLAWLN
jgi:TRAP-type C4-dicarboxylate transport system permease large subunit